MQGFDHHSGEYLDIEGAKIYYEVIGNKNGQPLLFLHGALGNIEEFNDIILDLSQEYKIIGIDNRGHGKSALGSQELSYELLQKEVEAILAHLNISVLNIFGFSNGGTIAYRLAAFTRLNIKKIITVGSPWHNKQAKRLIDVFKNLTVDHWKEECYSDYESYQKLNPEPDVRRIFKSVINMALDQSDKGRPNENIKNILCPMLITRGESDPIVSNSDIVELSKILNEVEILNISSASHKAFHEQPKVFREKLNAFLSNNAV